MGLPSTHQKESPEDKNGNSWGYVKEFGILSTYTPVGIDSRRMAVFEDDEGYRQEAFLDTQGSFSHGHLRQGGWYHSDTPYEHIVNTAEEFGRWKVVEPEYVNEIEDRGIGDITPAGEAELGPSNEAEKRWRTRGDPNIDILTAWEESKKIVWPRRDDPATARYHPDTGCTILEHQNTLITVYPNPYEMDESWLREEILSQTTDMQPSTRSPE